MHWGCFDSSGTGKCYAIYEKAEAGVSLDLVMFIVGHNACHEGAE